MWKELGNLLNTKKKNKGNSRSKLIINNQEITKDLWVEVINLIILEKNIS